MLNRTLHRSWLGALLLVILVGSAGAASCSQHGNNSDFAGTQSTGTQSTGTGGSGGNSTATGLGAGFATGTGGTGQTLDVQPAALQTITVVPGQMMPPVAYTATLNGTPASVAWSVDRVDIGTLPTAAASSASFTPTGTTGGLATISASLGKTTVQRQVMVKLTAPTQSGPNTSAGEVAQIPTDPSQLTAGGGVGGVGGTGLGGAVTNFPTTTMPAAMGLTFLYPYDKTVWPRGMLAPLLMWSWTPGDADAIQISLSTTSGSFSWTGQFGRPPASILAAAGGKFINHPIPQDVWDMATNSAGSPVPGGGLDQLTVSLTVATGGVAYGPITETWTIAPGRLAGTVYYNSYGTSLVKNSSDNDHNGHQYGAAVLGIQGGSLAPVVVAGPPSDLSGSGCRVCHVVAADGSRLIVQHGDNYARTSTYDLKASSENVLSSYDSTFGWAGLYPDGSLALTNTADLAASASTSQLYAFPPAASGATPLAVTGIPANLQAGAPAFSPDGKHVSFEFLGGTIAGVTGSPSPSTLVVLDFDKASMTFSNLRTLATMTGSLRAGLPSFFPTNDAVAFHYQLVNSGHRYNTWSPAQAQIWWSDLQTGTATMLSALNGLDGTTSYLPTGPNNHANDTTLNYEPTVAPVVSGGYAWVIFTSRRLYGNVATHDPWLSDPRNYDDTQYANITDKKLWVAAVDIGSIKNGQFVQGWTPGSDPSHPAFYLPAQELVAGNARGFWVLDPCRADGMSCMTGDQCCNGYCEPTGPGGSLVCGPPGTNMCAGLQDKCTTAADCCNTGALCINGFCALPTTQ